MDLSRVGRQVTQSEVDPWNTPIEAQYADGRLRAAVLQAKVDQLLRDPDKYNERARASLHADRKTGLAAIYRQVQDEVAAEHQQRSRAIWAARRRRFSVLLEHVRRALRSSNA